MLPLCVVVGGGVAVYIYPIKMDMGCIIFNDIVLPYGVDWVEGYGECSACGWVCICGVVVVVSRHI